VNKDETITEIKKIVSQITRINISELSDEVRVREELGIDSLMAMEIVASCEKRFSIYIDEEQVFNIETIGDFYDLIVKVCEEKI
jgi:acyl carrier protein